jgi:hypothetical protein
MREVLDVKDLERYLADIFIRHEKRKDLFKFEFENGEVQLHALNSWLFEYFSRKHPKAGISLFSILDTNNSDLLYKHNEYAIMTCKGETLESGIGFTLRAWIDAKLVDVRNKIYTEGKIITLELESYYLLIWYFSIAHYYIISLSKETFLVLSDDPYIEKILKEVI